MSVDTPARTGRPLATRGKTAKRYAGEKLNDRRREFAELISWEGLSADEASERVGVSPATGRQWLRFPAVLDHLAAERKAVLAGERPKNIRALVDVRDTSQNAMARVNAAKALEDLADTAGVSGQTFERPGYVLAIPDHLLARLHATGGIPQIPSSMTPIAPTIEAEAEEIEG